MVQNNNYIRLVDALKCLRDDNLSRLQIDILLNADEEDLIRAYYDMDGEFSGSSKCCNAENPYLSIPLALCCCATSVAMVGCVCAGICLAGSSYGGIGSLGYCHPGMTVVPLLPAKCALELVKQAFKVQEEVFTMTQNHTGEDLQLNYIHIHDPQRVVQDADNIFLNYLQEVCSLHTYTATDKTCIEDFIRKICRAKNSRHSNNLGANINLLAADSISRQDTRERSHMLE